MTHPVIKAWNVFKDTWENIHASYNSMSMIEADHRMIHDGKFFGHTDIHSFGTGSVHWTFLDTSSLVGEAHLREYSYHALDGPGYLRVYEGAAVSSEGLIKPVYNLKRSSTNSHGMRLWEDPVVTTTGTQIDVGIVQDTGGIAFVSGGGAVNKVFKEWVITNAYNYLVSYHNAGAAMAASQHIAWYEPS